MAAAPQASEAAGISALRKVTRHLIPLIALGYGIAFIDRANISFAALQMNRDLHFSATIYGLGAGLFFLGYAACEVPSNLLLCRFGARRWLSRIMITWGILATAMLFVRTPTEFYIARLLLGIAEAGFFPGIIFYLMQWFPAHLRARAISRFYISLPLSAAFMGLVAGALLNLDGHLHLRGWQWLFLIEGAPAILLGVVFFLLLPDSPEQATWLTTEERLWMTQNIHNAPTPLPHCGTSIHATLRDPRVLQFGAFHFLMLLSSYAYLFVAPDLIQRSTHLSTTLVGFITAAYYLIGAAGMILNARHSDRTRERYRHIIPFCLLISLGFLLCGISPSPLFAVTGLPLIAITYNCMQAPLWALPAEFLKGRSGAAGIAAINTFGIIGGFFGPYIVGFMKDHTGSYQPVMRLMTVPMLLATALLLHLRRQSRQQQNFHASGASHHVASTR